MAVAGFEQVHQSWQQAQPIRSTPLSAAAAAAWPAAPEGEEERGNTGMPSQFLSSMHLNLCSLNDGDRV